MLKSHIYSIKCIQRPPKVSNKSGLLQQVVFNPLPNKPWFLRVCSTSLLKTLWEKEKLLNMSNFSFSKCFPPVLRTLCHFHRI